MKNFAYASPRTEAEVVALLSPEPGRTEVLAGGTDLVGLMRKMIVTPDLVVNILEVPSLKGIESTVDGGVRIGAATTLDDVLDSPHLAPYAAVTQAIRGISSPQLQCQGTLGGELCQRPQCWFFRNGRGLMDADAVVDGDNRFHAIFGNSGPAKFVSSSRLGPALIALGAQVRVVGPGEEEQLLPVETFFRTPRHADQRETVLAPNQLLTHVILPPSDGVQSATYEARQGVGPEYPLAAAAAAVRVSLGAIREARIVLGQVAPQPWVADEAAQAIVGRPLDEATAAFAGEVAVSRATPLRDNEYKVQLARVAVKRALLLAAGLETGGF